MSPELEGLDPEDYPDIVKMRILADVAPYSREYQRIAAQVRADARNNPDLDAEYGRIAEQVRQTKESTLQVARRHFNAPVDRIERTVKAVHGMSVERKELPGRTFHLSSVGWIDGGSDQVPSPPRTTYTSRAGPGTPALPVPAGYAVLLLMPVAALSAWCGKHIYRGRVREREAIRSA